MIRLGMAALLFWGVATHYIAEEGAPLYCDQFLEGEQVYRADAEPWVAVDVGWYQSGIVKCGQELTLIFEDGTAGRFVALDAGRFEGRWVQDWPGLAIRVDVPAMFRPSEAGAWRVVGVGVGHE